MSAGPRVARLTIHIVKAQLLQRRHHFARMGNTRLHAHLLANRHAHRRRRSGYDDLVGVGCRQNRG